MFGIDDAIIGALISGGSSLFGGLLKKQSQDKANALSLQQSQTGIISQAHQLQALGLNPAGVVGGGGSSSASFIGADGAGEGVAGAGQDIGRAIAAIAPEEKKQTALKNALLQAQIDQTKAETNVVNTKLASNVARTFANPGTALRGVPLPIPAPGYASTLPPLYKDYTSNGRDVVTLIDPEAQRSIFSGVPGAPAFPAVAAGLVGRNLSNAGDSLMDPSYLPRPDTSRFFFRSPVPYMY